MIEHRVRCALLGWVALHMAARSSASRRRAGSDVADAAQKGDRAAVQKLIQQKADVNAPQVDGATALHWAVYRDDPELADVLIRAGANVKAANREGVTPLAMAALYGNAAHHRPADQSRRRCEAARTERRDDADVRRAQRQPAGGQRAARSRRRRQRARNNPRDDRADVGRRAEAS